MSSSRGQRREERQVQRTKFLSQRRTINETAVFRAASPYRVVPGQSCPRLCWHTWDVSSLSDPNAPPVPGGQQVSVLSCPFPALSHTHPHSTCWGCVLPLRGAHLPFTSFKRAVTCGQAHSRPALTSSSDTAPRDLLFEKDTSGGYNGARSLLPFS